MALDQEFRPFVVFAFGALLLGLGIVNRVRPTRAAIESSKRTNAPFFIRNGVLGQLPLGLGFVLAGLAAVVDSVPLAGAIGFGGLFAMVLAFYVMLRRPGWALPAWMEPGHPPSPAQSTQRLDMLIALAFAALVLSGLLAFLFLVFGT